MEKSQYHTLRRVEDTHWWFRSLHELALHWLLQARAAGRPRILDAGCGTGGLLAALARVADAEGLDASPVAVDLARARRLQVRRADLDDPGLEARRYDAIACIDVLYHRGVQDERKALHHLANALRPGGLLFLHLPAYDWLRGRHDDLVHGARRYRRRDVTAMLTDAGLQTIHASYRCTTLLPAIALWRVATRASRAGAAPAEEQISDVRQLPAFVNAPLLALCRLENRLARRRALPFGSSVYAVGRKPLDPEDAGRIE